MRTLLFALAILTICSFRVAAQHTGKITGRVTGMNEKTAEPAAATVTLLRAGDSAAVRMAVAARDGSFAFDNLAGGQYLVSVTAAGHQKSYSGTVHLQPGQPPVQLPDLLLKPAAKTMAGVTVAGKRPLVEQKIDRMVVNVEAAVTNAGATALEVLEKSPGITVDKDGNISLKGKEGVLVTIDGRPTQLSGADLANLLRNMNAAQMDQVEIMTNPPARYDAAGNAGIINIKTKKNKTAGYNGTATLSYGQGRYPSTSEGLNFNYRQGKVNVFTSFSHNYRKGFGRLTIQRNLRNSNTKELESYFDQEARRMNEGNSYNGKVGLDYMYSRKSTFGLVFGGFYNPTASTNRNVTAIASPSGEPESVTRAVVSNAARWKNFSTNLNYRTVLDSAGRELTADLDFITYGARNGQYMVNAYFNAAGDPFLKADTLTGNLPQQFTIYSGRVDYLHPLKGGARWEAGIKSSIVHTDNDARYDSLQYGRVVHDFNRSNHFLYTENINAVYLNLSAPLSKKWNAQLGLRLENTHLWGNQLTTGITFYRPYTQLFPTAYFQYKANDKNSFGINYGRRVRRPNYESLNPFIRFMDRYTYSQGNPDLRPQFSHNIELSHTYRTALTTTLNYTATNDIIQSVIEQKGQEAYARQANIASLRQFGLAVSANQPVTKWWTANLFTNVFHNRFEGVVNNTPIATAVTTLMLNGSQQFKLSKTLTAEVSGIYRTAGLEGVVHLRSMGMLSAGFSQQVLKTKGTLRLTVRDILYTQQARATIRYGNVDATFQERRDSRVVNIGFSYRFSKGKAGGQRKRTAGSAGEEQNRVGVD